MHTTRFCPQVLALVEPVVEIALELDAHGPV